VGSNRYQIRVWVRSAGSTLDTPDTPAAAASVPYEIVEVPPLRLLTLAANLTAPQMPGTTVTFTATGEGGTPPYQYKWWIFNGVTWTAASAWSASNTFAWTPTAGNPAYFIGVWLRSAGNAVDAPEGTLSYKSVAFPIGQATGIRVTSIVTDLPAPQAAGTTVNCSATATGGVGPYQYRWWLFDGATWVPAGDWTSNSTWPWRAPAANPNVRIGVWVRSAGNTSNDPESPTAYLSIPYPITAPAASNIAVTSLTSDLPPPLVVGESTTFTATASGGATPYQYRWWVWDGVRWVVANEWTTANRFAWTPAAANVEYRVGVWARSAGSAVDADPESPSAFTSIPMAVVATGLVARSIDANTASPLPAGGTVIFTASGLGGNPPYSYQWWVFDGTTWAVARDWGSDPSFAWTPTEENAASRVGVWMRSSGNGTNSHETMQSFTAIPFAVTR
jgi:hypothetical protein